MVDFAPMDDIDRIMAVMQAAFDPLYGESWTRAQVDNTLVLGNCHYLLIGEDGAAPGPDAAAAGFALSRCVADEEELLLFAVSPAHRRRGLGTTLLSWVKQMAQTRGVTRMFLEMRDGNPAESLYRINGFLPVGRRPKYYRTSDGERIDAITFALDIN
jgi:[ribosomal protein S18]-alanine N-acetyltransferase